MPACLGLAGSLFEGDEGAVFPRAAFFNGLDMDGDLATGQGGAYRPFDALADFMASADGQLARHQEVEVDKTPGAGPTGTQRVVVHPRRQMSLDGRAKRAPAPRR